MEEQKLAPGQPTVQKNSSPIIGLIFLVLFGFASYQGYYYFVAKTGLVQSCKLYQAREGSFINMINASTLFGERQVDDWCTCSYKGVTKSFSNKQIVDAAEAGILDESAQAISRGMVLSLAQCIEKTAISGKLSELKASFSGGLKASIGVLSEGKGNKVLSEIGELGGAERGATAVTSEFDDLNKKAIAAIDSCTDTGDRCREAYKLLDQVNKIMGKDGVCTVEISRYVSQEVPCGYEDAYISAFTES